MNAQAIGRLGSGLLGVWAFIEALFVFPRVASAATFLSAQHGAYAALFAMALPFVLLLGLSYLLVFRAAAVAQRVLSPLESEPASPPTDLDRALVGLVGIFILLGALHGLLLPLQVTTSLQLSVASLVQAGVGLVMVLRPAIFLALWRSRDPAAPSGGAV